MEGPRHVHHRLTIHRHLLSLCSQKGLENDHFEDKSVQIMYYTKIVRQTSHECHVNLLPVEAKIQYISIGYTTLKVEVRKMNPPQLFK